MGNLNRLGRIPALDPRDRHYSIGRALTLLGTTPALPDYRYWTPGPVIDQEGGSCTGASTAGCLMASPVRVPSQQVDYLALYRRAQDIDEFSNTPPEEGSSVRAALRAAVETGRVLQYLWAQTIIDAADWVIAHGPVIAGTDWHDGMMEPDDHGFIHPTGPVVGGHAWLIDGVNKSRRRFRMLQSWGNDWGKNGHAWITFDEMVYLFNRGGEIATVVEAPLIARP